MKINVENGTVEDILYDSVSWKPLILNQCRPSSFGMMALFASPKGEKRGNQWRGIERITSYTTFSDVAYASAFAEEAVEKNFLKVGNGVQQPVVQSATEEDKANGDYTPFWRERDYTTDDKNHIDVCIYWSNYSFFICSAFQCFR